MTVIAAVRHIEPDLVQPRRPLKHQLGVFLLEVPALGHLPEKCQCRGLDALGLRNIDVIAPLHRTHGALARVLIGQSADHVIQNTVAQGALRHAQVLDAERIEELGQDHHPPGKYRTPFVSERVQSQLTAVSGVFHIGQQGLQTLGGDAGDLRVTFLQALTNRAHGTGTADHLFPTPLQEGGLHGLDFYARRKLRSLKALRREPLIAEVALT